MHIGMMYIAKFQLFEDFPSRNSPQANAKTVQNHVAKDTSDHCSNFSKTRKVTTFKVLRWIKW